MKIFDSLQNCWEALSSAIVHAVEHIFFVLGLKVAKHPWKTISITWVFIVLSAFGFTNFYHERNPIKLWVPPESDFIVDTDWLMEKFGNGFRPQKVLITADNVLDPNILLHILEITNNIKSIQVNLSNVEYSWNDLCFKVPVIGPLIDTRSMQNYSDEASKNESYFDPSVNIISMVYCSIVNNLPQLCLEENIVDIWSYNQMLIKNSSTTDLLLRLNGAKTSPTTGHPFNFENILGGITRNKKGSIVSAKSVLLTWYLHVEYSDVDLDKNGNIFGTEEWTTEAVMAWESKFIDVLNNASNEAVGYKVYYQAGRSYGDISGATMFQEMDKLFLGIGLMFFYIQFIMAGTNCVEFRLTLGSVGLLCIGMAYITSCSWCAIIGIPFGPVHASLPFLLMGLGIDDMFVMKACWEQLTPEEKKLSLPHQVAYMLKHAGVSIVITSFTDIVAFLVGSITILPSLRSFCLYAAMGVFFIFCFSVTFYVAVFTLDEKRIKASRNGLVFCYQHNNYVHSLPRQSLFQKANAMFYEKVVFTIPCKIFVLILTVGMTCYSIQALFYLEQRFDPMWFIPDDTYFKEYLYTHENFYPEDGQQVFVLFGSMDYNVEADKLYNITKLLQQEQYVRELDSWITPFKNYIAMNYHKDYLGEELTNDEFNWYLTKFLYSPAGGRFRNYFRFNETLTCGSRAPNITGNMIPFKFKTFSGPKEYLPAMHRVKAIVRDANITTGNGYRSVWSKLFANWVTDEMIALEVERNVELALICVMACTIILITNLQMCLWIFICVLLTLVNVCGWMQRWGLTIDIVSCIGLELAIGLCVDYAAHVGHTFLTLRQGTKSERSLKTITSIGTAVLYGGGSTLLSLSILSMSKSYTFNSFFKIFLLVIIFGLFHGLIFLPVVLSLVGPKAYAYVDNNKDNIAETEIEELNKEEKSNCNDT